MDFRSKLIDLLISWLDLIHNFLGELFMSELCENAEFRERHLLCENGLFLIFVIDCQLQYL